MSNICRAKGMRRLDDKLGFTLDKTQGIDAGLSTKKKACLKKFVEFEEKHGNAETVAVVKQKAVEYVQSKGGVEA